MLYVASDIHGEYELFLALLKKINFSNQDKMIICGDIIDKGPNSIRLAQFIFRQPNIQCILGNHEYAFLQYYWSMMKAVSHNFDGVLQKLQEYFANDGYLLDWETVDEFEKLPLYIEEEEFICVHAGVPLDVDGNLPKLQEVEEQQLLYDRNFKEPHVLPKGSKCVLFGHTPTMYVSDKVQILRYPKIPNPKKINDYYKIHLDMGTMFNGVLGCLCVDTGEEFYVSHATRR